MKTIKKTLTFVVIFLTFAQNFCYSQINTKPFELNISNADRCFVFSSMDWFNTIYAYNGNFDRIFKMNVKKEASQTESQLVTESFDYVYNDYSYFVFKKGHKTKIVKFDAPTQIYNYISKKEFNYEKKNNIKQKHIHRRRLPNK